MDLLKNYLLLIAILVVCGFLPLAAWSNVSYSVTALIHCCVVVFPSDYWRTAACYGAFQAVIVLNQPIRRADLATYSRSLTTAEAVLQPVDLNSCFDYANLHCFLTLFELLPLFTDVC